MGQACVSSCVSPDAGRAGSCEAPLFHECAASDEVIISTGDDGMRRARLRNRSSGSKALPEEFRHELGLNSYLGTCSLGCVVRTLHTPSGSTCALKRISKKLLVGTEWREDVSRLQELEHRHICRVKDAFEDATSVYLVMDLCRGSNLNSITRSMRNRALNEAHVAVMVHQMLQAVCHLHSAGYVHSDICPENWLFDEPLEGHSAFANMTLKMIDFGLAKKHSREQVRKPQRYSHLSMASSWASDRRSSHGTSPGRRKSVLSMGDRSTRSTQSQEEQRPCPLFCQAPEQLEPGYVAQRSCDVWALGVIAYFLLSGTSPFEPSKGVTDPSNNLAFRNARYVFMPTEVWRNVSREAKSFIALCLELAPSARPPAKTLLGMPWMQMARGALESSMRPSKNIQVDIIGNDVDSIPALSNTVHGTPVGPRLCFDDDPLPRSHSEQSNLSRMSEFQLAERDAVMLVAHSVHKNHMPILQKFLEERDPDRCGLVTFAVLVQGMRFCGVGVKDMDDISGAVCYTDFLSDVVQFQKNMQESALWFAFSTFDIKCTGEADRRALQKELCDERSYLYECFRVNFPSLAPEAVLSLLEQAPSSRISFEELMGILQRLSPDSVDLKEKLPF